MAITHISNSASWVAENNPISGNFTLPTSGHAVGDLALCMWYSRASTKSFNAPDYFVSDGGVALYDVSDASYGHLWIGAKPLTQNDIDWGLVGETAWSSTYVNNATTMYGVALFRGVNTTTNCGVEANSGSPTTGTNAVNAPAVTPLTLGACVVAIGGQMDENDSFTVPTNYTDSGHASSTSGTDAWGGLAYILNRGTSSQDPAAWGCENTAGWYAWTCALKPADETSPVTFYSNSYGIGDTSEEGLTNQTNATYATARELDPATSASTTIYATVGQTTGYTCYQSVLSFPTYTLPDNASITTGTFSVYGYADVSTTDFDVECRQHAWGSTLDTSDVLKGSEISGATLFAHFHTSATWSTTGYNAFTTDSLSVISKTGHTDLQLCSSRQKDGNTPTDNEFVQGYLAAQAGTTYDPKLYIEFTSGGANEQGAIAVAATTSVAAVGSVSHAAWTGALACAGVTTVTVAGGRQIKGAVAIDAVTTVAVAGILVKQGALAAAATSAVATAATVAHATWQGATLVVATTSTAVAGSVSHANWQGALAVAGSTTVTAAGAVAHAAWQGAIAPAAVTTTAVAGSVAHVGWQGAIAVAGSSTVEIAGAVAHRNQQGELLAAGASTVAIAGTVQQGGQLEQGAFAADATSTVACAGSVVHANWQGAMAPASATTVAIAGTVSHQVLQGALAVAGSSTVAIAGTRGRLGELAAAGATTVATAGTVSHAAWTGELLAAGATTAAVAGTVAHRNQQGALAVEATTALQVSGSLAHAAWAGELVAAGSSAVAIAGSVGHAAWQGAFAPAAATTVAIAGTVAGAGPTIDAYRVGDAVRIEWVI